MSVLRRQRRVSLHLQRGQLKSETSLWNVYVQISSAPHTSHRTHSMPLTKLYIYSSVDGRWALFSRCVYLTYRKRKKTRIYWSTMWPPGDKQGKCRSSAEVFFFFFFFAPSACCSVLCCPSVHTQSGLFTVKSAADLRKILHTEVASKGCRAPFGEADGLPC